MMAHQAVPACAPLIMAFHAPAHGEWDHLPDSVHGFYRTMAFLAGDAILDVAFMRKSHVPGQPVNPNPGYRLSLVPERFELLDFGFISRRDLMAAHAYAHRGDSGNRRPVGIPMAKQARQLVLPGVDAVAVGDRLLRPFSTPYP